MSEASEDEALLREMVREAERVIDHQIRATEQLDGKSQSALTLGIAALGGGLALGSLVLTQARDLLTPWFLGSLAVGGALNVGALVLILDAYTGLRRRRDVTIGPVIGGMLWRSQTPDWHVHDHLRALLASLADHHDENGRVIRAAHRRHRGGLIALAAAVGWYAIGLLYIMANAMGA